MAAVVRVKRHRGDDPADRLVIACKKQKPIHGVDECHEGEIVKETFKFAGTAHQKDEPVRRHVNEALRKEKLSREYKVHAPFDQKETARSNLVTRAKEGRFHLTLAHRTGGHHEAETDSQAAAASPQPAEQHDSILCLYDAVLHDSACTDRLLPETPTSVPKAEDTVTCNGLAMVKVRCEVPPPSCSQFPGRAQDDDFVYDIYYANRKGLDLRMFESILHVEAFTDEHTYERDVDDCQEVYDDEDDSNDEGNWRNDYPDEDPRVYDEEIGTSDSDNEGIDEFDADPIMDYFTSKCNLDAPHAADDVDHYEDEEEVNAAAAILSYARHKQDMMKELEISCSEESDNERDDIL